MKRFLATIITTATILTCMLALSFKTEAKCSNPSLQLPNGCGQSQNGWQQQLPFWWQFLFGNKPAVINPAAPCVTDCPATPPPASTTRPEGLDHPEGLPRIGDDASTLPTPDAIHPTPYSFDFYIYHSNYTRLLFVAVQDGKVVGFFTDADDFEYAGLTPGMTCAQASATLGISLDCTKSTLKATRGGMEISLFFDSSDGGVLDGIFVLDKSLAGQKPVYTQAVLEANERQSFYLVNGRRAAHGLPALTWNDNARNSARAHCKDMNDRGFFSHTGSDGSNAGTRMTRQGVNWRTYGENIACGGSYHLAMFCNFALYNSPSHRKIMLHPDFTHLGVGVIDSPRPCGIYYAQNYYR
ncbi:MAG: CAP domain-containing protein [Clostridia bacterium]|nr:CAP domain-containing protein [Clostridia bacterium]